MLAATTDCWTDELTVSYASLTVHGITLDWQIKSKTVMCSHHTERNTGEALSNFLVNALKKYGILEKIVSVTVDNASNSVAMMRISGDQFVALVECERAILTDHKTADESDIGCDTTVLSSINGYPDH